MKYLSITPERESHLTKLIDFLAEEALSAGGDGDALWYSKYFDVNDILPLVKAYTENRKLGWEVWLENGEIHWGNNQEWVLITNQKHVFDNAPEWQQIKLVY